MSDYIMAAGACHREKQQQQHEHVKSHNNPHELVGSLQVHHAHQEAITDAAAVEASLAMTQVKKGLAPCARETHGATGTPKAQQIAEAAPLHLLSTHLR